MTTTAERAPLLDHVDARLVTTEDTDAARSRDLVRLDPDHPGFSDPEYRARRNRITEIA